MSKKNLLVLFLAAVIAGGVFAQTDFESMPKNTIVVDFGPTIIGLTISQLGAVMGGGEEGGGVKSTGFGLAGQYERQLLSNLSVGGKVGFLTGGLGMTSNSDDPTIGASASVTTNLDLSSFTLEGHVRFYPFGETFFLDGMLGWGVLTTTISGEIFVKDSNTGLSQKDKINIAAPRNYLNLGAKIGWRIDFGNSGGFVFEPSFGYYFALGLGDTIVKQIEKQIPGAEIAGTLDEAFNYIEELIFIGGPRFCLAFGFRF